ncbi:MAG: complex I subunit 4 family protein [Leadbetterella sp.]
MLVLIAILLPLFVGGFLLINSSQSLARTMAYVSVLAEIVLFLMGVNAFNQNSPNIDFKKAWIPDYGLNFHIGWDALSLIFTGIAVFVVGFIVLGSSHFKYSNQSRLLGLVFLTQSALIGLFTSKDLVLFYFYFEIALLPVYIIANIWGGKNASKVTFKMLVFTIFGSLIMLMGFVVLAMRGQTSQISEAIQTANLLPTGSKSIIFYGLLLAFGIKTPIFPLHTWLPDAYSESPSTATMLLSALLSKMGIYGILRLLVPISGPEFSIAISVVVTLGIIGLIYGAIIAIKQNSLKSVLAFSSMSHMGLIAAAALTGTDSGVQGAILQSVAHAVNAAALFYVAKLLYDRTQIRDISQLGGIVHVAPRFAVVFLILVLSSVALPLTSGFVGEFLMLKSIFDFNLGLAIFAGSSIVFGAVYMLRYYQKIMFGEENAQTQGFQDLSVRELTLLSPVVVLTIVLGVYPNMILSFGAKAFSALVVN